MSINKEQLAAMAATVARVFIAAALGQVIAYGSAVLEFSGSQWKGVAAAGIAAAIVVVFQWVNTGNSKYGRGYEQAPTTPPVMGTDDVGQPAVEDVPETPEEAVGEEGYVSVDPNTDDNFISTADGAESDNG